MDILTASPAQALFFTLALTTLSTGASNPDVLATPPEKLADGNLRDPEPTPDDLRSFILKVKTDLVLLRGGTFEMGDWGPEVNKDGLPFDGSFDSKPLHKVTLSDFYMSKYPVTYSQFDMFTAAQRLPRINQRKAAKSYRKPDNPAGVTWQGAKDYCQWLGKLTGQRFDLPTEAQWEFAARSGGKRDLYPTDNGKSEPGRNLPSYEQEKAAGGLVAVSSFPPNHAGVHYMSAGVHEFTNDWYDAKYYEVSPEINPAGPANGTMRVVRGFYGNDFSAMTFKRWNTKHPELTGTWTSQEDADTGKKREIPHTKYSNHADSAFRCVLNPEDIKNVSNFR